MILPNGKYVLIHEEYVAFWHKLSYGWTYRPEDADVCDYNKWNTVNFGRLVSTTELNMRYAFHNYLMTSSTNRIDIP